MWLVVPSDLPLKLFQEVRGGGECGYSGTFIEQYLEPLLYPIGLTGQSQLILGFGGLFRQFRDLCASLLDLSEY